MPKLQNKTQKTKIQKIKTKTRFLYKWLWCSWKHYRRRCYPSSHNKWHCNICHPCNEELDYVFDNKKYWKTWT